MRLDPIRPGQDDGDRRNPRRQWHLPLALDGSPHDERDQGTVGASPDAIMWGGEADWTERSAEFAANVLEIFGQIKKEYPEKDELTFAQLKSLVVGSLAGSECEVVAEECDSATKLPAIVRRTSRLRYLLPPAARERVFDRAYDDLVIDFLEGDLGTGTMWWRALLIWLQTLSTCVGVLVAAVSPTPVRRVLNWLSFGGPPSPPSAS